MEITRSFRLLNAALLVAMGGCATRPSNPPVMKAEGDPTAGYRFESRLASAKDKDNLVILAFSGGGRRCGRAR